MRQHGVNTHSEVLLGLCTRKSTRFGKTSVVFGLKLFACLWEQINFQLVNVNEEKQEQ